jgi:hypothetical protein
MPAKITFIQRMTKRKRFYFISIVCLLLLASAFVRFNIKGHFEGLFLLKGIEGYRLELKDDLYLGDAHRLIWGIDFDDPYYRIGHLFDRNRHEVPYLTYEWMEGDGKGYVRNFLPGGEPLLTVFSRFTDEGGMEAKGLFVGGGLPAEARENDIVKMNQTGMAFFDGKRWFHIWCNANEAMFSPDTMTPIYPSQWRFVESKVWNASDKELTLYSRHIIKVGDATLQMDRVAYFTAGEPYFILSMEIRNISKVFAQYVYTYGDEPWLGNYGTSGGNVGWVKGRLIQYVGTVDSRKYNCAGFFDYGNDAVGEGHKFTRKANFLQWDSDQDPILYFTNSPFEKFDPLRREPLTGNARFIGIQFSMDNLLPGESVYFDLAIGMAHLDLKTGLPVKPATLLDKIRGN